MHLLFQCSHSFFFAAVNKVFCPWSNFAAAQTFAKRFFACSRFWTCSAESAITASKTPVPVEPNFRSCTVSQVLELGCKKAKTATQNKTIFHLGESLAKLLLIASMTATRLSIATVPKIFPDTLMLTSSTAALAYSRVENTKSKVRQLPPIRSISRSLLSTPQAPTSASRRT